MANIITFYNPQRLKDSLMEGGLKFLKKTAGSSRIKKDKDFHVVLSKMINIP